MYVPVERLGHSYTMETGGFDILLNSKDVSGDVRTAWAHIFQ
jgi:hypothetical protein